MNYIPEQGDIIWIDHSPTLGRDQSGFRPSFVLSHYKYNRFGFVVVCPITSKQKGYGSEIILPSDLKTKGVILTDQIKTMDWEDRGAQYKERTNLQFRTEVYNKIKLLIKPSA